MCIDSGWSHVERGIDRIGYKKDQCPSEENRGNRVKKKQDEEDK
jgi:hypothetical protein